MNSQANEVHLLIDDALLADPPPSTAPRVLKTVRIPDDMAFLHTGAAAESLVTSTAASGALVIEPLADGPHPRLLLLTPNGATAPTLNGHAAPRVCLLRIGDQLLLDNGRLLHVTVYSTPIIGPPGEQQIGATCPVCRTPITGDNSRVFTCPCGCVVHHDDPADTPDDSALECAAISSECPACHRAVCLRGGFEYVPDVD